jgi:hypothetical protein
MCIILSPHSPESSFQFPHHTPCTPCFSRPGDDKHVAEILIKTSPNRHYRNFKLQLQLASSRLVTATWWHRGLPQTTSSEEQVPGVSSPFNYFYNCIRSEVLKAVNISMLVLWVVIPYGLVGRYRRFGGTYCLHKVQ